MPEWRLDIILNKKPPRPEDVVYAVEDVRDFLKDSEERIRRRSGLVVHPTEMKPPTPEPNEHISDDLENPKSEDQGDLKTDDLIEPS